MKRIILKKNNCKEIIFQTLEVLTKGGLVVFPSDTVYGLLCDATNKAAVEKLIKFKNRPPGKAISVFVKDSQMFNDLVMVTDDQQKTLNQLLPGPYTIVLPLKDKTQVSSLLISEQQTLGIRYPKYPLINQLLSQYKKPITATSANLSYQSPHYSVDSLLSSLPKSKQSLIDLIVDNGELPHNKPSTVLDFTSSTVKTLRLGNQLINKKTVYQSTSPEETIDIAQQLMVDCNSKRHNNKPLVIIIEGEMGVGKTVFVKGVGQYFNINNIISPTYVIFYEYSIERSRIKNQELRIKNKKLKMIHVDLYNIQDKEEFKHLELEKYLKPGNILCFEWGEKAGEIIDLLKSKGNIVYVKMKYAGKREREIIISF